MKTHRHSRLRHSQEIGDLFGAALFDLEEPKDYAKLGIDLFEERDELGMRLSLFEIGHWILCAVGQLLQLGFRSAREQTTEPGTPALVAGGSLGDAVEPARKVRSVEAR